MTPRPAQRTTVRILPRILAAAVLAAACSDSIGPGRGPAPPLFSFSPNGITLDQQNSTMAEGGRRLVKGFNPTNPQNGDAIVVSLFWVGQTNIVDSVTDHLVNNAFTTVGNTYHLVEYVTAGGVSMATFVATNVQNIPLANPNGEDVLAVVADLRDSVPDGGIWMSSWRGVEDVYAQALGATQPSASGAGAAPTAAHPGTVTTVNPGALIYGVTMARPPVGVDPPPGFTHIDPFDNIGDATLKADARYSVRASPGSVDPQWTWFFDSGHAGTWLATGLVLNASTGTTNQYPVANFTSSCSGMTCSFSSTSSDPDGTVATYSWSFGDGAPMVTTPTVTHMYGPSGTFIVSLTVRDNQGATNSIQHSVTVPANATTGTLTVSTSTTGSSLDPDGYTATVDGTTSQPIPTNGSVTFTGLASGSHSVAVSGVAANSRVGGANPQTVNVPAGGTATAAFSVSCASTTGNLTASTSTTGSNPDPDGYTATVDGTTSQPVPTSGSVTFSGLASGSHAVALSGVATNCTVSGGTSQTVTVPPGGTATASFSVGCTAMTGSLTVSTSTTGSTLDPDGYTVTVDGSNPQAIGINASLSYTNLAAGSHSVTLSGVAANCTVSGANPQTVSVPAGGTATTTFSVSCTTPPGNLTVTTSTTGTNVDPDGYTVAVDGGPGQAITINGSITFTGLSAGSHSVTLSGVAGNCTVGGANPQTVTVPSGGTTTAPFSVSCAATTGDLAVTTSTTGSNLDPDGYTATVDGGSPQAIGINASVSYTNLSAGTHTVALSGVAGNCTVSGGNSQTATVPAGGTATVGFVVSCTAMVGDLTVTTSTTGSNLDPDGYTVTVDGGSPQAIGINASVTYTSLSAGNHTVAISGVAANCTVSGGTSQTVTVPSGGTATTTFTVTCSTPPGNLTVSTNTTGSSLDPDGYTVTVDGGSPQAIGINASVSYTNLSAGNHTVAISGVAGNCTVSGGTSQTVTVPSGGTATTTFSVTCAATTGNLTVTTNTTGADLPTGYTITVDGTQSQSIAANGSVTFTALTAGDHSVEISGDAPNCTLNSANPQTVTVPAGGTATATFSVTCTATTESLTVSTSTTGSSLDPDGYTVTVDGGSPQAIGINASVSYTNLSAGTHTVAISGVAANCTVSGGTSQTVNVPSGGTATTTFSVSCTTPPGNLTVSTSTTGSSLDPDGYTVTVDGGSPQAIGINASVSYTNLTAGNHTVAISGVAANCTVSGGTSQTVSVPSGGTATTTFSVSCTTPPGNLTVSTSTRGSSLDPDGYTVTVDGGSPQAIGINASVSYTNLSAGNHTVAISGVAGNCTVSGGTSRTVNVPSGGTATTTFSVSCSAPNS